MTFPDPERAAPIRPDLTVAVFAAVLSLITVLLFGLVPALRAARVEPALCLKRTGAGGSGVHRRLARVLILVQVALAVVLASGAGLFARTLVNLGRIELGFRPQNLLVSTCGRARTATKRPTWPKSIAASKPGWPRSPVCARWSRPKWRC